MAAYYTTPHQPPVLHPSYSATYHSATSQPLYQTPAYSVPTIAHSPPQVMPTYYVPASSHISRSQSHSHQPVVYTTSGGSGAHYRDYGYSDAGRRRRSSSVGHGGHYYSSSSGGHHSAHRSSSRSPTYYTTSSPSNRLRSHSTSHHHSTSPQYYDAGRHSSSSHRPSISYSDQGHYSTHRRHSDTLGDRFRRWFGMGSGHHTTSRNVRYEDARTGRPVDRSGRPIYRV